MGDENLTYRRGQGRGCQGLPEWKTHPEVSAVHEAGLNLAALALLMLCWKLKGRVAIRSIMSGPVEALLRGWDASWGMLRGWKQH